MTRFPTVVAALLILCGVSGATADINILYSATAGFYRSDDTTGLLAPGSSGNTALVQLIFSVNNVADAAQVGGGVSGDDSVLEEITIDEGGTSTEYGEIPATPYIGTYQAGFIYVRVFDQGTSAGGAGVALNTWYYNGPLEATVDNNTATPDLYDAQGGNPSVTYGGFGDFLSQQVVPEPTTSTLIGLGGLMLAVYRRLCTTLQGSRRVS